MLRTYFLIESIILALLAYIISMFLVKLISESDYFRQLLDVDLSFKIFGDFRLIILSLILTIIIGFISGLYPATYLSSLPAISAISSNFKGKKGNTIFRKVLIVFQFILSIGVLIGVLSMNKQVRYIDKRDLGFNKNNLLIIPLNNLNVSKIDVLKDKLLEKMNVVSASTTYILPNSQIGISNFSIEAETGYDQHILNWMVVDYDYIKTMGMKIIEGRDFDKNIISDNNMAYIVNEAFIRNMGWNHGVGKRMQIIGGGYFNWEIGEIIGVVKDFNISSLHNKIEPIVIVLYPGGYLHVRINGNNVNETINNIQLVWNEVASGMPFQYSFMDQQISQAYNKDINQLKLVKLFSIICFILSCLGLISLFSFTIAQRTKEIAIRKQLGASIIQIINILFKDIVILIIIAIIITIPLSDWLVNKWLDGFAYRIDIGLEIYIISSLTALVISFLSILYHSLKAAFVNPIEALKYE